MTIVTACALYAADTENQELAKAMADDGRAILLESEEWYGPWLKAYQPRNST